MNKVGIFILVYNRTTEIPTLNVLHQLNVYNNIYLVVGKDDPNHEFIVNNYDNVLLFDKKDVADEVDSLGSYRQTLKVCTYARVFVDRWAKENNIRYICLLFDDIKSMQLRYVVDDKVKSCKQFDLNPIINAYIELLNCNDSVYMVGPPVSSFYIGCSPETRYKTGTHNGNMLIYDTQKQLERYKANVLEDVCIVLYNSMKGHIALFPFGLQVNIRPIHSTEDAYSGISKFEFFQQRKIVTYQMFDDYNMNIPHSKFSPKIISDKYRKE